MVEKAVDNGTRRRLLPGYSLRASSFRFYRFLAIIWKFFGYPLNNSRENLRYGNITMTKETVTLLLSVIIPFFVNNANAQEKTCNIDPQKKAIIAAILCGQAAREDAYRFSGDGCAKKSIEKRLEDSAIQIHMYNICGDQEFARQIREATVNSMKFTEALLPCTGETFSLDKSMNERIHYVEQRAKNVTCDSTMKSTLRSRRSAFETMIKMANNPETEKNIFEKLRIALDKDGSVIDK